MAVAFGMPALAMLNGAFTVKDQATGATSYTTANLTGSLQGAYLTALLGSVKLSAVSRRSSRPSSDCCSPRPW